VKDLAEGEKVLNAFRNYYPTDSTQHLPKWQPGTCTQVSGHVNGCDIPFIVDVALPFSRTANSEGVRQDKDAKSGALDKITEFARSVKADEIKRNTIKAHHSDVSAFSDLDLDYEYSISIDPVINTNRVRPPKSNMVFLDFERTNQSRTFPWLLKKNGRWDFSQAQKAQLYAYNATVLDCRLNDQLIVDDEEACYYAAVQTELENELSLPDAPVVSSQSETSRYEMSWDLHRFGPLTSDHYACSVSWSRTKDEFVERVLVMDLGGHMLMDHKVGQGPEYLSSLFQARRMVYMLLYGSTIYGFNIYQHLSRLGLVGDKVRIVDLVSLPCIRGAKPAVSVEKLQMRYGRSKDLIVNSLDTMADNLAFSVFLMRRDAVRWRYRRRFNL